MGATSQPQVLVNWKQVCVLGCVLIILKYIKISIIDNLILIIVEQPIGCCLVKHKRWIFISHTDDDQKNMQKYEIQQRQPGQVCGVINISEVAYLSFVFHHLVYEWSFARDKYATWHVIRLFHIFTLHA